MQLLAEVQSFHEREKCMAHSLLSAVAANPGQDNFILFVGQNHLLPVAKHISDFLKDPASFGNYRRPP
jgi:hypothetical protein